MTTFSFSRWVGIIFKEFIQLRRDRLTFGMVLGIPVLQLLLFGYAINTDPKNLPAAVLSKDNSSYARTLVMAMQNSGYFKMVRQLTDAAAGDELLDRGEVQFVIEVPEDFSRKLARGETPQLLLEADATDPQAAGNAIVAMQSLVNTALARDLAGALALSPTPLAISAATAAPAPGAPAGLVDLRIQRRYNPEGITAYNIVPGLLGTILTMTMVLMTGLAMTRERERGTFENLLSTPALPIEVMTGKIVPYIMIGLVQMTLILVAALWLFKVPMQGSVLLLYAVVLVFVAANLALGITFSSVARNQLQAMQMTFFFFLPSILLSGFMFPYRGMPEWAQWVSSLLPLTHFLVLVRSIMLKGIGLSELWPQLWPILAFMVAVVLIGLGFYKRTLD
jgi:ABC-2 type transport system permease protein